MRRYVAFLCKVLTPITIIYASVLFLSTIGVVIFGSEMSSILITIYTKALLIFFALLLLLIVLQRVHEHNLKNDASA